MKPIYLLAVISTAPRVFSSKKETPSRRASTPCADGKTFVATTRTFSGPSGGKASARRNGLQALLWRDSQLPGPMVGANEDCIHGSVSAAGVSSGEEPRSRLESCRGMEA